jgi:phenylalanyl-tRNA synthetase beta chain
MVHALRWNLDRDQRSLRLFEIGKTYTPRPEGLPEERWVLTLGLSGCKLVVTVNETALLYRESEVPFDIFDLKGDAETVLQAFDLPGLTFEAQANSCYETGVAGRFVADGKALSVGGRLHRDLAREYKLREPVWLMELDLETLIEKPLRASVFHPYSKFPAVERDFSLLAPESVPYGRLEEAIRGLVLSEIQDFRPVEQFRGGAVPAGQYSLLLRVTFQSADHTLTSEELNEAGRRLLAVLERLGARLRS